MEHRPVRTLIALAFLLVLTVPLVAQPIDPDAKQVAAGSNRFAMDVYARLAGNEKGNLFFSPYSIETALAMTYAGARGNTAEQMARVLHFDLPQDKLHQAFADLSGSLNRSSTTGDQKAFELVVANAVAAEGLSISSGLSSVDQIQIRRRTGTGGFPEQ